MPIHKTPLRRLILTPVIVVLALGAWTIGNGIFRCVQWRWSGKFDDAQALSGEAVRQRSASRASSVIRVPTAAALAG